MASSTEIASNIPQVTDGSESDIDIAPGSDDLTKFKEQFFAKGAVSIREQLEQLAKQQEKAVFEEAGDGDNGNDEQRSSPRKANETRKLLREESTLEVSLSLFLNCRYIADYRMT
jgi:hypothetical protein